MSARRKAVSATRLSSVATVAASRSSGQPNASANRAGPTGHRPVGRRRDHGLTSGANIPARAARDGAQTGTGSGAPPNVLLTRGIGMSPRVCRGATSENLRSGYQACKTGAMLKRSRRQETIIGC
jgi:hypothetical protein